MEFLGSWVSCPDGVLRPMLRLELQGADSQFYSDVFLVDTGSDRTVLSARFLQQLNLSPTGPPGVILSTVGGPAAIVAVNTSLRLTCSDGQVLTVRGTLLAFTGSQAGDFSVLGRDVVDEFDLLVERKKGSIRLLCGVHSCQVIGP